eukprot:12914639-Prorocentrum_lima.AAC.1
MSPARDIFVDCYGGNRHLSPNTRQAVAQPGQEEAHNGPVVLGGLRHTRGAPAIANQTQCVAENGPLPILRNN